MSLIENEHFITYSTSKSHLETLGLASINPPPLHLELNRFLSTLKLDTLATVHSLEHNMDVAAVPLRLHVARSVAIRLVITPSYN